MLLHICGLTKGDLPVTTVKLFYHASGLFLCIAFSISLYQWLFIAMRVNLYGGKFGFRSFIKRVQKSKWTYTLASAVIFTATLVMMFIEVFTSKTQVMQAVSIMEIVMFSGLLLSYIITGTIIIRNLYIYFKKHYNQQRHSLLVALILTIVSLVVLQLRYILEFIYNMQQI